MEATTTELAAAFTEWERRWREDPAKFWSDTKKLADSPESYGEACVPYFVSILESQRG